MGFYSRAVYEDYVEKNSSGIERDRLFEPRGEPAQDMPGIGIVFDPMPVWMELSDIITLDVHDLPFSRMVAAYRFAADIYRNKVMSRLRQIQTRLTGKYLLEEFDGKLFGVRIVPYRRHDVNADVVTPDRSGVIRATARGRRVDYSNRRDRRRGEGTGAGAIVEFDPDMWSGRRMAAPSNAPDEVLYHELVHASRYVNGVFDGEPVNKGYDDAEEYLAIVLTNIYMSEKGQWIFAGDHDVGILQGRDAIGFLNNPQHVDMPPTRLIENFRNSQRQFYDKLAHLPPYQPKYNWVRQYDLDRPRYLHMLQGNFRM